MEAVSGCCGPPQCWRLCCHSERLQADLCWTVLRPCLFCLGEMGALAQTEPHSTVMATARPCLCWLPSSFTRSPWLADSMTGSRTCQHMLPVTAQPCHCGAGGRVTGPAVISELITELHASVEAAAGFEGEMQNLASYAAALAMALECIRDCGDTRWALQQGSPYHSRQQAGRSSRRGLWHALAETCRLPRQQQCSASASSSSAACVHPPRWC